MKQFLKIVHTFKDIFNVIKSRRTKMKSNDVNLKGGYNPPKDNVIQCYDKNCILPSVITSIEIKNDKSLKEFQMPTNYAVTPAQMPDWKAICNAFANKVGAELLFVNETSCGVQYKDGTFGHIYIDEMYEFLKNNNVNNNA